MAQYWLKRTRESLAEGPLSATELRSLAGLGGVTEESLVSADNRNWIPASRVRGLFSSGGGSARAAREEPPPAPPPPPPTSPPAPPVEPVEPGTYEVHQETKACPYCGEQILAVAIKCKHCGERLGPSAEVRSAPGNACQTCGADFGESVPYNFYGRFRICKRCRNSLINRRAGAYVLDVLMMMFACFMLGCVIGALAGVGGASQRDVESLSTAVGCFSWLVAAGYILLKDGMFQGQSPGRAICGIRVIDLGSGAPGGLGHSAKRNLPLLIPLVPLVVAFQINGGDSSRWGDGWAETAVVRKDWLPLV